MSQAIVNITCQAVALFGRGQLFHLFGIGTQLLMRLPQLGQQVLTASAAGLLPDEYLYHSERKNQCQDEENIVMNFSWIGQPPSGIHQMVDRIVNTGQKRQPVGHHTSKVQKTQNRQIDSEKG